MHLQADVLFHSSNNDHVIDVHIGDSVDFFCPHYTDNSVAWEYYVIYMVNKSNYEMCVINDTSKWIRILNCSRPNAPQYYTLYIYDFQPVPGNPDFIQRLEPSTVANLLGTRSDLLLGETEHRVDYCAHSTPTQPAPPSPPGLLNLFDPLPPDVFLLSSVDLSASQQPRVSIVFRYFHRPLADKAQSLYRRPQRVIVQVPGDKDEHVPGSDGFPGDNVIHVGVGDKNEGTITDSGAPCLTFTFTVIATTLTLIFTSVCRR
ncbi:hypothetical protein BaRGS_00017292 [Batillaria attramentaria]|uniref:Ephrin RBD domain-containing protein n=1 Tax=Batillaria attramentaria TaxID=370345 RepID=A0ABD0KX09_9CAEN